MTSSSILATGSLRSAALCPLSGAPSSAGDGFLPPPLEPQPRAAARTHTHANPKCFFIGPLGSTGQHLLQDGPAGGQALLLLVLSEAADEAHVGREAVARPLLVDEPEHLL